MPENDEKADSGLCDAESYLYSTTNSPLQLDSMLCTNVHLTLSMHVSHLNSACMLRALQDGIRRELRTADTHLEIDHSREVRLGHELFQHVYSEILASRAPERDMNAMVKLAGADLVLPGWY